MMTKVIVTGLCLAFLLFSGDVSATAEVIIVEFVGTPSESPDGTITIVVSGLDFNQLRFFTKPGGSLPKIEIDGKQDSTAKTTTFIFKRPSDKLARCNFHTGEEVWGGVVPAGILGVMNIKNKRTGDTDSSFYLKKTPEDPDIVDLEMYW